MNTTETTQQTPIEDTDGTQDAATRDIDKSVSPRGARSSLSAKPKETLPSERLSFERQIEALKAYASQAMVHDGLVTNEQASSVVGIAETTIVVTNAFFTDIGILERSGSGQFKVSELVMKFGHEVDYGSPTPGHALRPLLEKRWFAKALLPHLSGRDISRDEAIRVLAMACGAPAKYRPNVDCLISYLEFVGLVANNGGIISKAVSNGNQDAGNEGAVIRTEVIPAVASVPDCNSIPVDAPFLFLDRNRERKVTLIAPNSLTKSEVTKIKAWLELVLFVEDDTP